MRNDKCLYLLQFIRSPWKQVLESSNSRGASFNLRCFCASLYFFNRFGNFLLTWSTDNFPWGGCTVVGQVSKLHLRGSPELFAKARPIVIIFQMPHIYLHKHRAHFFNCLIQSKDLGGQFGGPQLHCIACRAPVTTRGF